jgi:hypothetical protein
MTIHTEINFEDDIFEHLAAHGWLYAEGDAGHHDRSRALFSADVVDSLQQSQSDAWYAACTSHGANADDVILGRLCDSIKQRGKKLKDAGILVTLRESSGSRPAILPFADLVNQAESRIVL